MRGRQLDQGAVLETGAFAEGWGSSSSSGCLGRLVSGKLDLGAGLRRGMGWEIVTYTLPLSRRRAPRGTGAGGCGIEIGTWWAWRGTHGPGALGYESICFA
jgi:hypothetical protein